MSEVSGKVWHMFARLKSISLGTGLFLFLITVLLMGLLVPGLAPIVGLLMRVGFFAGSILVILAVALGMLLAANLPPLTPVAETSALGKRIVGVSRSLLGMLVFFGGMVVTWVITMDVALQGQSHSPKIETTLSSLFQLLLTAAPVVAYFYWMWIAADLIRVGKFGRIRAAKRLWQKACVRFDIVQGQ